MNNQIRKKRLLIIAEDVLYTTLKSDELKFHQECSIGSTDMISISVWSRSADDRHIDQIKLKFGVIARKAPIITKEMISRFDFIAMGYNSFQDLVPLLGKSKPQQIILVYNIWDSKMGACVTELSVPENYPPVEHLFGFYPIIPRVTNIMLGNNAKRTVGIFISHKKIEYFYKKKCFFDDFDDIKFVPIYYNGAYNVQYDFIIAKASDFNLHRKEKNEEILTGFLRLVEDIPRDRFLINIDKEFELGSRASFINIGKRIKESPMLTWVKDLPSIPICTLADIPKIGDYFMPSDFPLLVKSNSASKTASKMAHTFALLEDPETYISEVSAIYCLYEETEGEDGPQMFIQRFIKSDNLVIKGYVIGENIFLYEQDGSTQEDREGMIQTGHNLIDFEKLKKPFRKASDLHVNLLISEVKDLASIMKEDYDLEIFGFDLLKPLDEDFYYFIDLNQFVVCNPVEGQQEIYRSILRRKMDNLESDKKSNVSFNQDILSQFHISK